MRFAINRFNNHQFQSHFSIDAGRFENIGILRENKDPILKMGLFKDPVGAIPLNDF